jgi:DNA-binding NtrC family response regulator
MSSWFNPHNSARQRRIEVLKGKTILAVDDEPDVLETIEELLDMCRIETAGNFHRARQLLRTKRYDMVILDIMGVKGLDLLDTAVEKDFPCVMLTAPALSPEYLLKAMQQGATSYLPKEDLANLDSLLTELFDILATGDSPWHHTLKRLEPLLDERFPSGWKENYRELWDRA